MTCEQGAPFFERISALHKPQCMRLPCSSGSFVCRYYRYYVFVTCRDVRLSIAHARGSSFRNQLVRSSERLYWKMQLYLWNLFQKNTGVSLLPVRASLDQGTAQNFPYAQQCMRCALSRMLWEHCGVGKSSFGRGCAVPSPASAASCAISFPHAALFPSSFVATGMLDGGLTGLTGLGRPSPAASFRSLLQRRRHGGKNTPWTARFMMERGGWAGALEGSVRPSKDNAFGRSLRRCKHDAAILS